AGSDSLRRLEPGQAPPRRRPRGEPRRGPPTPYPGGGERRRRAGRRPLPGAPAPPRGVPVQGRQAPFRPRSADLREKRRTAWRVFSPSGPQRGMSGIVVSLLARLVNSRATTIASEYAYDYDLAAYGGDPDLGGEADGRAPDRAVLARPYPAGGPGPLRL